jgi:hypothetical protein
MSSCSCIRAAPLRTVWTRLDCGLSTFTAFAKVAGVRKAR